MEEIEKVLPSTPLVLHGASSIPPVLKDFALSTGMKIETAKGVPEDILRECSKHHICKINVDSDIRIAYTAGVRETLNQNPGTIDIRDYNKNAMLKVKELVKHKMENVFLSANKN